MCNIWLKMNRILFIIFASGETFYGYCIGLKTVTIDGNMEKYNGNEKERATYSLLHCEIITAFSMFEAFIEKIKLNLNSITKIITISDFRLTSHK